LIPLEDRLEIAAGAVKFRDGIIDNLRHQLAEATRKLEEARKDAERGRHLINNSEWRRHPAKNGEPAYAMLCVRLPYESDLSCKAFREEAIDQAIEQSKGGDES
jgi:hypothetical protein